MKHNTTLEEVKLSFEDTVSALRNHFISIDQTNTESIKLAIEYYKWTTLKINLLLQEKDYKIPSTALPNIIKPSTFQWLHQEKQDIVSNYYQYDNDTDKYILSVKKTSVPYKDVEIIMRSIVLIRKNVVWVDFGYNIGTEFGGKHPAIIMKNLKDSLIVIPLSSQQPKSMDYNVQVDKVYGFPLMTRWTNVTRITQVSLSRIHYEKIGDVKPFILKSISDKLKVTGII